MPERIEVIESHPVYGQSSRVLFLLFMAYERVVNLSPAFEDLRFLLLAAARKPA